MNERFLAVDAASVKAIVADLKVRFPELEEDAGLFSDVLEGQTSFYEVINQAIDIKLDADAMVEGIKLREQALEARRKRFEDKSDAMRVVIQQLMEAANQQKVTLPVATLSTQAGRSRTVVYQPEVLPQGFFSLVRKPDTKAITEALKAGEDIPGATLERGHPTLAIRTK